ncbi:MAG TPA: alpha/beta hydrolase fold domain-containing protein, partial [Gemmatimonadaceae bacterium]|nr:alpha/beta hydrolase fold domain-containing protein [Gemmatimonadaceae bacterium]
DVSLAPPALVVTGGFDPLRDEGREWGERLQLSGVRVVPQHFPSLVHGFLHMTAVSAASREAALAVAHAWRDLVAECRARHPAPPGSARPVPAP